MTWKPYYHGDGVQRRTALAAAPPWRNFPRTSQSAQYQPPPGLIDAVNAALFLRRPLLITGPAGSGKSTVIDQVAHELDLGNVLRWHITSRSSLSEALYRYDALGRIHAQNLQHRSRRPGRSDAADEGDNIEPFIQLGPLGTALLPAERPRALVIDEIDKGDLDLPSDLLDVLERGEYEIPELARYRNSQVHIRKWDSEGTHLLTNGCVQCTQFPFIVLTSNGEREFPAPFLRRCIRYAMPQLTSELLRAIVLAHFQNAADPSARELVEGFAERIAQGEHLAVDQLLNAIALLTGEEAPEEGDRAALRDLLLQELSRA